MVPYKKREFESEVAFSRLWFKNYFYLILGSLILALGFSAFIVPHHLVPGGVFGLSIVINNYINIPIGLISLIINIPLLFLGIKILGTKSGIKTFIAMIIMSLSIDGFGILFKDVVITEDHLVSAIFGGVLIGIGIALVIRSEATTGGTDLIAQIIAAITKRPVGQLFLFIDGIIVILGILAFKEINLAPYAIISIFANSRTVDALLNGRDLRKAVLIISQEHERVRDYILSDLDRGGTYLNANGLYFPEEERPIIFSVLNRKEMAKLQNAMKFIDPNAFLTVLHSQESFGSGFKPFK